MAMTFQIARGSDLAQDGDARASRRVGRRNKSIASVAAVAGTLIAGMGFAAPADARRPVVTPPNVVYPLVGGTALRMIPLAAALSVPSLQTDTAPVAASQTPAPALAPVADASASPTDATSPTASPTDAPTVPAPTDTTSVAPTPTPAEASPTAPLAPETTDPRPTADVAVRCGAPIVATTPGRVSIIKNVPWSGGRLVKVLTDRADGLTTVYGHLRDITVRDGDVVLSGEKLGRAGKLGTSSACTTGKAGALHFEVLTNDGAQLNPRAWLAEHAGKPIPGGDLFGNQGFRLATFNVLGASHTGRGAQHPGMAGYATRLKRTIKLFNANTVDVAGLQEFQSKQRAVFMQSARKTYGIYPFSADSDPENSIMWRAKTFDFVDGGTFPITYFNGNIRKMPWVKLRFKDGGRYPELAGREAYFLNVHNPATIWQYRGSAKWRAKAIATEIRLVNKLRDTGVPVFLTGDFNDKAKAYCPLSTKANMVSPQGGSEGPACDYPKGRTGIDWIFVAGDATFSRFDVDYTVRGRISDHPFYLARAHLAD